MHPVVRAAFKAVELLIKWLEGSTPSSSAIFLFTNYFYLLLLLIFLSSLTILNEQIAEILV